MKMAKRGFLIPLIRANKGYGSMGKLVTEKSACHFVGNHVQSNAGFLAERDCVFIIHRTACGENRRDARINKHLRAIGKREKAVAVGNGATRGILRLRLVASARFVQAPARRARQSRIFRARYRKFRGADAGLLADAVPEKHSAPYERDGVA